MQMNVYVPGARLILTFWLWPAWFTTSMPLPWMVNVWATLPTSITLTVCPFVTVSLAGEKTNWPLGPCFRVAAAVPPDPWPDPPPYPPP